MQENISNENCILGLQLDKFDDKITFDISKICGKNIGSFDKTKLNTIHNKFIQSIRITESSYSQIEDLISRSEKFSWDDIFHPENIYQFLMV